MKKIIFLMAAVLAAVTLLAAGLIVFPGPVQETQANPLTLAHIVTVLLVTLTMIPTATSQGPVH